MLRKFVDSIFDRNSTSITAFQVAKHVSDYVGMLMRLAFVALLDRLLWQMFENGAFGDKTYWFSLSIVYVASVFLWAVLVTLAVSIFNITYRLVVEMFDEVTGFGLSGSGIGWLAALMLRIFLGIVIALYGGMVMMSAAIATQNVAKFLGSQ